MKAKIIERDILFPIYLDPDVYVSIAFVIYTFYMRQNCSIFFYFGRERVKERLLAEQNYWRIPTVRILRRVTYQFHLILGERGKRATSGGGKLPAHPYRPYPASGLR